MKLSSARAALDDPPRASRLEAEVGEREVAVVVEDKPRHPAATKVERVRCLRPHLCDLEPAHLAAPAEVHEHEDALAVELAVLVYLEAETLPRAQETAEVLGHSGHARPAAGCRPAVYHELDLTVCPLGRAEVAPFPARVDRAHEVQVRRVHRPIIPAEPVRAHASPAGSTRSNVRRRFAAAGDDARSWAMDDEEPERERDPTDRRGAPEDPDHRSDALVVTGRATNEDPGMI
jgi:hypothetical protein